MKGVILAGGNGSRLYPATRHIPKSLLPLANRVTLEYSIERLKEIGISEICIIVGGNEDLIRETVGDGRRFGVNLVFHRQTEPLGLAHAVSFAEDFIAGDSFVLLLGDLLFGQSFVPFAREFERRQPANLSVVKRVSDPRRFGVANVDGDRIVRLVEKPEHPESDLATTGLYFFGPQVWKVLPELQPSFRNEYEITDAIQIMIDAGEISLCGIYEGEWFDTGTLDSFLETSAFLIGNGRLIDVTASVDGNIGDRVVVGAGADVRAASMRDCVILPGAHVRVEGAIEHAIIGGVCIEGGDVRSQIVFPVEVARVLQ